jgi:hypothetical protein
MPKYVCHKKECFFFDNEIAAIHLGVSKMAKKTKNKNSCKRHLSDAQIKYLMDKNVLLRGALCSVCCACSTRLNNIIRVDTTYAANKSEKIT